MQPSETVLVLEDQIQRGVKSYKLPLMSTEIASDQQVFSTSQPYV